MRVAPNGNKTAPVSRTFGFHKQRARCRRHGVPVTEAGVVRLLAPYPYLVEPPAAGVIRATLAKTVSGDAIPLVRDQPVLMIAVWDPGSGGFGTQGCGLAGVPLDSAEGRAALVAAAALFGPDRLAVEPAATDALDPDAAETAAAPAGTNDWWPLVLAFALAAGIVLLRHRIAV
jgi:hypothetical protein